MKRERTCFVAMLSTAQIVVRTQNVQVPVNKNDSTAGIAQLDDFILERSTVNTYIHMLSTLLARTGLLRVW
jgi:hypothetical protein